MPVESCSSCASTNLATQYAQQLTERLNARGVDPRSQEPGKPGYDPLASGPSINSETVGLLVDTSV